MKCCASQTANQLKKKYQYYNTYRHDTEQTETQPQTDTGAVQTAGQTDNAQAQETAVVQPEASQYLSQGYYIVQKGDSLVGICRKVYNTTAMMDKLCETNGIDNPDAIYEGQYLTLPN